MPEIDHRATVRGRGHRRRRVDQARADLAGAAAGAGSSDVGCAGPAVSRRICAVCATSPRSAGLADHISATTPATCGVAIEVPSSAP